MEHFDIKEAEIRLEFIDSINTRTAKSFKTVQGLATYLKDHSKVAEAVGYVEKGNKEIDRKLFHN